MPTVPTTVEMTTRDAPSKPGVLGPVRPPETGIDVWLARLEGVDSLPQWEALLSRDEVDRARRFRFEDDFQRFIRGRGLLRDLLASYLQTAAQELYFGYSSHGKPELAGSLADSPLQFNVAHSGDYVALAFAWNRRIGVDVERMRGDVAVEPIAERFFSSNEREGLRALSPPERVSAFFRCWTRKEAYVKAVGTGLGLPLRDFDVSLAPGQPAALLATRPDPVEAARWNLLDIPLEPGYGGAVAVAR